MEWISPGSYWHQTAPAADEPGTPPLTGDAQTDVAVIGAGITGLTTALHLQAAGLRVMVIEAGRVGAGTSGGTSGHLDALPDQGAKKLVEQFGEASARLVTDARMAAIDQIENWSAEFSIPCQFQRVAALMYSEQRSAAQLLDEQGAAIRRLGLDVEPVPSAGLPFATRGALRIARQARFHSLHYLRGLARQFQTRGGVIHEQTRARPPRREAAGIVETPQGRITAGRGVVLCTHSAYLGLSPLDLRVAAYQSYVVAARVAEAIPDALFWDDAEPYHYLRIASADDPQLVLIGGADHKTGQADERKSLAKLEEYVRERFTVESLEQRWSSELFEPADGLPYVGAVPLAERLYVSTGYSGTGLTYGTLAGRLLANLVLERADALAEVLSPSRLKPLAAGPRLVSENLNVARRFVSDRLKTETVKSLEQIRPGEGRLVRYHGHPLAAYRDETGRLHTLSPVCTHAGCFVQWNELEQTWDCPCHGGRYSAVGERLYGPPPRDLEPKQPYER